MGALKQRACYLLILAATMAPLTAPLTAEAYFGIARAWQQPAIDNSFFGRVAADGRGSVYVLFAHYRQPFSMDVRHYTTDGRLVRSWPASPAAYDIAVDPNGLVYVTELAENRIARYSPDGALLGTWPIPTPMAISFDGLGNAYVTGQGVRKVSAAGQILATWNLPSGTTIAADRTGNFYMPPPYGPPGPGHVYYVFKFSSDGRLLKRIGSYGSGLGQFGNIANVIIDRSGHLWTSDIEFKRLQEFSSGGRPLLLCGGQRSSLMDSIYGLAAGSDGIYVSQHHGYTSSWITQLARTAAPSIACERPRLSRVGLSRTVFRVAPNLRSRKGGATLHFTLQVPARVALTVQRLIHSAHPVRASSISGHIGRNTVRITGFAAGHRLKPGRYRLALVATDRWGNRSKTAKLDFRIIRR